MRARLRWLEQLMSFIKVGELIAARRQRLVSAEPGAAARAALRELSRTCP